MARKETILTVTDDNRDRGKRYLLTEWDSARAEDWGERALIAVARSGTDIPSLADSSAGMIGVALMSLRTLGGIDSKEVTGLLNELMECVQILPNDRDDRIRRPVMGDDIEEVLTRLRLKGAVFELHVGFTFAELKPKLISAVRSLASLGAGEPPPQ